MKKSSLALGLFVMVAVLFIFANVRVLVATLEKNETAALVAHGELRAEMYMLKERQHLPDPQGRRFFDRIEALDSAETKTLVIPAGKTLRLEIRRPQGAAAGMRFLKTLSSRQLDTLRSLKKLLSGLVTFMGLLLAVGAIYFMVLIFKKQPAEGKLSAGSPFQDYLVDLKSAQVELQELVAAQRRTSDQQEELNRSIINTVHLAVIYLSPGGTVQLFNPAAQALFQRSFAAAKNATLAEALPAYPELVRFISGAEARSSAEIESGGFTFYADVVPVCAGEGFKGQSGRDSKGRLALVRDVSEERQRGRIRRQNENLMMLGEMAASLAHEVRNSLGVVLGYSKALGGEPEKTRKVVREIEYMSEMMESFLRFAKPVEKVEGRPVDLGPVIRNACLAQEIDVDLPVTPMELKSDPLLLNVIFTNLALNARQAGASRLRAEFAGGSAPAVTLVDDGPGITPAVAEKIWLPFFTTRDKGTGMGLATVKKLVSALGADIQLLNPGEPGAKFRIVFYS